MWEISQKYGLKLKKLYRKNRMESPNQPKAGRVLWLRQNRPSNVAVEYREIPKPETPSDTQPPLEEKIPADSQPVSPAENKEVNIELENEITSGDEEKLVINNDSTLTSISPVNEDTSKLLTDQIDTVGIEVEKITVSDSKLNDEEMPSENEESIEDEEVFDENQFMDYSIRKGDTFFSISNQFNMKISTLLAINNLTIRDTLSIDQNIKVNKMNITTEELNDSNDENSNIQEVKTESSDQKEIKHEVSSGETMYALAKKYSVSLKEILEWNKKESYDLKEGEIIIIKKK
jgi:membrane-bound lytic murein transglycosylase D